MSQKIKSLFYESPKPCVVSNIHEPIVIEPPVRSKIKSIIAEGVMFGTGPKLYGTGQSSLGQSLGGGGGYAGGISIAKQPGETQFGVIEEEGEESLDDMIDSELDKEEGKSAEVDSAPEEVETPVDDANSEEASAPIEPVVQETPEQKITKMFADSGDIEVDYSLTNENNVRLEKFKYINAGIDLEKVIPEDDLKTGISSKDIMNLLTPSQRDVLRDKNRELRKMYPLIDKREKYIIIHNSNVPVYNNENTLSSDMKRQAYDKINAYLETNFGKNWQDKTKAINFLRTIKINFANSPAIRANLIDLKSMSPEDGENYKIPLDKVNVFVPSVIKEFIKSNKEDPLFSRSNIFRTLISGYNQEIGSSGQVYVVLNSESFGDTSSEAEPDSGEMPSEPEVSNDEELDQTTNQEEVPVEEEPSVDEGLEDAVPELPTE
jgi:hypothetical protein